VDSGKKEIILDKNTLNTIAAGEIITGKTMKIYPVPDITPGTYWFGMYVDSQNTVSEKDETNNAV